MSGKTLKFLRKCISPYPKKVILDELIEKYGENDVLNGNVDLYKAVKELWKNKNSKEKNVWKQALA